MDIKNSHVVIVYPPLEVVVRITVLPIMVFFRKTQN